LIKQKLKKIVTLSLIILILLLSISQNYVGVVYAAGNRVNTASYGLGADSVNISMDNVKGTYKIAWVSDLHMMQPNETNINHAWYTNHSTTFEQRNAGFNNSYAILPKIIDCLNANDFDAIVFGGDMMDNYSEDNFNYLKSQISRLNNSNVMFLVADHDYLTEMTTNSGTNESAASLGVGGEIKQITIGNDGDSITLIGQNFANREISDSAISTVSNYLNNSQNALYFTHVPIESQKEPDKMQSWSKSVHNGDVYYWSSASTSNGYKPKSNYLNTLYNSSSLRGVFAGHVHSSGNFNFSDGAIEHVFNAAFKGIIGVITINGNGSSTGENTSITLESARNQLVQWALNFKKQEGLKWKYIKGDELYAIRGKTYKGGYPQNEYKFDCVGCVSYILHYSIGINYEGAVSGNSGFVTPQNNVRDTKHFELHYISDDDQPIPGDILIATKGQGGSGHNHVAIYCGNGQVVDCRGTETRINTVTSEWVEPENSTSSLCKYTKFARLISVEGASFSPIDGDFDITASGNDVEEVDLDEIAAAFKYNGMPTEISSTTTTFRWLFDDIGDFGNYILGILLSLIRIPIVGLTSVTERSINTGLHNLN